MNNNNCCIIKILQVIDVLQNKAERIDDIPNTCDRPFLGFSTSSSAFVYNTRPVTLYNAANELLTFPYTLVYNGETINDTSSVFRVEKVNDCCATLRVLAPNPDGTSTLPYVATNSFFTISSGCICALKCLDDTFVDCI